MSENNLKTEEIAEEIAEEKVERAGETEGGKGNPLFRGGALFWFSEADCPEK